MWKGKPLKAITDDELSAAVRTIPYQSRAGEIAIMEEVERRWREEGVDLRPMNSFVEQKP